MLIKQRSMQPAGRHTRGIRLLSAVCVSLLSLALLTSCDTGERGPSAENEQPWPQAAIVADLSQAFAELPAGPTLAELKAIGFDTVLLDAQATSRPPVQQWIEAAKAQKMRTAVAFGSAEDLLLRPPNGTATLDNSIRGADGVVVALRNMTDLEDAEDLRAKLNAMGDGPALIASLPAIGDGLANEQLADRVMSASAFDAVFITDATDDQRLLQVDAAKPSPAVLQRPSASGTGDGLPRWQRVLHCQTPVDARCSEDVRLLVMGLMRPATPVTGIIEGPYWRDVYASLIRLRRETPWIRDHDLHWYAPEAAEGVLAYRISSDLGQHVIVAINVSDGHHELPLPSGFMAVSKIRFWASYDPTVRELVTSKPVVLPARSAVVVVENR